MYDLLVKQNDIIEGLLWICRRLIDVVEQQSEVDRYEKELDDLFRTNNVNI